MINATVTDCACQPGWAGEFCDVVCPATLTGRLDLAVLMDVSGTIASNPNKDQDTFDFFQALLNEFDTVNQVQLSITSFSDDAVVDLPMGHYSEPDIFGAVNSIDWVGGLTDINEGLQSALGTMNTTDDVPDIMIFVSDGFDSFDPASIGDNAADISNAGVDVVSVGFGLNGFVNFMALVTVADNEGANVFTASTGDELLSQTTAILEALCTANSPTRMAFEHDDPVGEGRFNKKYISTQSISRQNRHIFYKKPNQPIS